MNAAGQIIAEMIESNLQQAWAALGAKQWAIAKHHLQKATEQVDQLAEVSESEEEKQQPEQPDLLA